MALPVFTTLPDQRLAAIGITGGLDNKWIISLRTPSLVRSIRDAAAYGVAGRGGADPPAAAAVTASSSAATAAPSRRTPSRIRSGVGAENDSRTRFFPLPSTKNASPAT